MLNWRYKTSVGINHYFDESPMSNVTRGMINPQPDLNPILHLPLQISLQPTCTDNYTSSLSVWWNWWWQHDGTSSTDGKRRENLDRVESAVHALCRLCVDREVGSSNMGCRVADECPPTGPCRFKLNRSRDSPVWRFHSEYRIALLISFVETT